MAKWGFHQWKDGSTNPTRIITVTADTTIMTTCKPDMNFNH